MYFWRKIHLVIVNLWLVSHCCVTISCLSWSWGSHNIQNLLYEIKFLNRLRFLPRRGNASQTDNLFCAQIERRGAASHSHFSHHDFLFIKNLCLWPSKAFIGVKIIQESRPSVTWDVKWQPLKMTSRLPRLTGCFLMTSTFIRIQLNKTEINQHSTSLSFRWQRRFSK